jgi:hypothetical protein
MVAKGILEKTPMKTGVVIKGKPFTTKNSNKNRVQLVQIGMHVLLFFSSFGW